VLLSKRSSRRLVSMITGLICKETTSKIRSNGASTLYNPLFGVRQVRSATMDFQGIVDTDTGCEKLAVIEENIVTAFSEVGGDSNDAIIITLNRAYRVRIITFYEGIP